MFCVDFDFNDCAVTVLEASGRLMFSVGLLFNIIALSIKFLNSLMLPGQ